MRDAAPSSVASFSGRESEGLEPAMIAGEEGYGQTNGKVRDASVRWSFDCGLRPMAFTGSRLPAISRVPKLRGKVSRQKKSAHLAVEQARQIEFLPQIHVDGAGNAENAQSP